MLGMHGAAFANYAVDDCDFLIAVGARFDDRVAGVPAKFAVKAKRIAHLDIDRAEINKVKHVDWSHVGALADALRALTAYGREVSFQRDYAPWLSEVRELKRVHAMNYDRESPLIQPYYVLEELNRHTRGEAIITNRSRPAPDVGGAVLRLSLAAPVAHSGSMGTMGFGLPAAIGAQIAHPDRLVIDIDGRLEHPHEHRRA